MSEASPPHAACVAPLRAGKSGESDPRRRPYAGDRRRATDGRRRYSLILALPPSACPNAPHFDSTHIRFDDTSSAMSECSPTLTPQVHRQASFASYFHPHSDGILLFPYRERREDPHPVRSGVRIGILDDLEFRELRSSRSTMSSATSAARIRPTALVWVPSSCALLGFVPRGNANGPVGQSDPPVDGEASRFGGRHGVGGI